MKVEIIRHKHQVDSYIILVNGHQVGSMYKLVERGYPYPYKVTVNGMFAACKTRSDAIKNAKRMATEYGAPLTA